MNNNYFYKLASVADHWGDMKKYGAEIINAWRKVATSAPKISSPTSTPTTPTQSTTPSSGTQNTSAGTGTSAPPQTPTTPASQPGMVGYRPQTPEDLVNHWVAQKEHYYRNRTDKFADRYKNYTVSPEAKRLMAREAQKIWGEIGSDPNRLEASHLEREGAFNTAMDRYKQERDAQQQKQQEQAAGAPMQNPTDTSAIQNPAQPTWTSEDQRFQQASQAYNNTWWNYYNPDPQSQQGRDFRLQRASALRPYYPQSYIDSQIAQGWWDDLGVRGMQSSPDADIVMLERAMQQAYNWNQYAKSMPANTPQLQAQDRQNQALWNLMQRPDGKLRTPQELADYINTSGVSKVDLDPQILNILQNRLPNITL